MKNTLRYAVLALALIGASCAPPASGPGGPTTVSNRSASDQRAGAQARQEVLGRFGGEYQDAELQGYVTGIGRRIAAVSEQPNLPWTFTVLNDAQINAFATPGGYVYVTRGLVALAEDEAELASVIGHEIAHITAGHNQSRQSRSTVAGLGLLLGQIGLSVLGVDPNLAGVVSQVGQAAAGGYVASYSRADELEADNLGIRYLARAGYDPLAAVDFLDSLAAFSALRARIKGQEYDPNRVSFLASHPATGQRVQEAAALARAQPGGGERGEERHLRSIDGIVWGDSPEQGFVRGRTFAHPALGFTFTVPAGFTITNSSSAVVAEGPSQSRFILDGGSNERVGRLSDYIRSQWVPAIARSTRVGQPERLEDTRINGLEAARAILPAEINGRAYDALLVAIRHQGRVYRLTGLAPRGTRLLNDMVQAAGTFRALSPGEAGGLRARRIDVVPVGAGQTVQSLGQQMQVEALPVDHFIVLNGLGRGGGLQPGERVKLVR